MEVLKRQGVWLRLRQALERCAGGEAAVVLVEGAAGCGKSALLGELAHAAQGLGALVLRAEGGMGAELDTVRNTGDVPYGVLRQLLACLPGPVVPAYPAEGASDAAGFASAVLSAARQVPVVVCVDGLESADAASLGHLLHLCGRMRGLPVLLVLTRTLGAPLPGGPQTYDALLRHQTCVPLRVGRLGVPDTAALVARLTGSAPDASLVAALHRVSGGNPLLLKALLDEHPAPTAPVEPLAGGPFARAVAVCLRRSGPHALRQAAALAVLGEEATVERAARLTGALPGEAGRAVAVLEDVGLLDGRRLRHPVVAEAALAAVGDDELRLLRVRAARLLHDSGARAASVAGHLLLAHRPGTGPEQLADVMAERDWAVGVLGEAARQALVDDDTRYAVDCLSFARDLCDDPDRRCEAALRLSSVLYRTDPAAAERCLAEPLGALRRGTLGYGACGLLARLLLGQGRMEEAVEALEHAARQQGAATGEEPLSGLLVPASSGQSRSLASYGPTDASAERRLPAARAAAVVWPDPVGGVDEAGLERLLQGTALTHGSFDVLVQAIRILVHADRCDRAVQWCHKLQADADSDRSPGWYAALGLLCAQALLRLGDLPGAQRAAAEAAAAVQGRGGLLLFGLVAVEVTALTGRGQCAEAARRLELPVPQELFASVHVLDHLRARGLYRLATHGYEAALADFLQAGRLAVRWGLDQPERLPWRTDAATVLLRLGRGMQARRLIDEQLSLPGARAPRAQGTALRLRAATAPPAERPWLLSRAESELRRCGDRLEHARALADLGRALQVSGAGARAGSVLGRAWQLAADCGATALCEEILPGRADRAPARRSRSVVPTGGLTESERRVAAAAALGHTNREIAARLYVTVSTVEQHLTRVYRKLGISRRSELPLDLSDDPDPAPEPA